MCGFINYITDGNLVQTDCSVNCISTSLSSFQETIDKRLCTESFTTDRKGDTTAIKNAEQTQKI